MEHLIALGEIPDGACGRGAQAWVTAMTADKGTKVSVAA
jgi:hypothetical protein